MRSFKIIASDLDGTLLNSRSEISEKNLAAIEEINRRGVHFVPCTGRAFTEIPEIIRKNSNIRYIIYSNGAALIDTKSNTKILNGIPKDTAKHIFDTLARYETYLTIRHGGNCYVDLAKKNDKANVHYNLCLPHINVVDNFALAREDFEEWMHTLDDIEVVSAFFHSDEECLACRKALSEMEELFVASSADYNLEIFNKKAGKGSALCKLADMLGVKNEETAAVGDSENDISMIRAAGYGFAVANASDELKAICDATVVSNDDDAINDILLNYVIRNG